MSDSRNGLSPPDVSSSIMTLNDLLSAVAGISGLLFVVTSMLAMSLSLSVQQMTPAPKKRPPRYTGAAMEHPTESDVADEAG